MNNLEYYKKDVVNELLTNTSNGEWIKDASTHIEKVTNGYMAIVYSSATFLNALKNISKLPMDTISEVVLKDAVEVINGRGNTVNFGKYIGIVDFNAITSEKLKLREVEFSVGKNYVSKNVYEELRWIISEIGVVETTYMVVLLNKIIFDAR